MRLSKCVKYFDSKCVKIDAICANSYTEVTISHKIVNKIWQSYSPVLLIFSISVTNLVTIGVCDV